MSQRKPNQKRPPDSLLTQSQLVDSLTSHISLYHTHSNPNPNRSPRSAILKWFSSLTVHQRQSQITTVDSKLARILIQMLHKLRSNGGHSSGSFIILPDITSRDGLPTLCFKQSRGLLSRVAETDVSGNWVATSARLFSSTEGESAHNEGGGGCCVLGDCVDSVTMSEEFVADVDRFVEAMDRVSGEEFLRGDVGGELGQDWLELGWLKSKGYYSIGEFVANRVEVALRLAWLNSGNGKKRGVKLKEKLDMVGKSANVFYRKKGCIDWWDGLDGAIKRKVLPSVLGKTAKHMVHDILKYANSFSEDEMCVREEVEQPLSNSYPSTLHGTLLPLIADKRSGLAVKSDLLPRKPNSVIKLFDALFVLQHICSMVLSCRSDGYDKGKLFFSTLHSFSTINDCILRKLRGFLMVISLDCTKLELLGEGTQKPSSNKSKEKHGSSSRKKKGRTRSVKTQELNPSSLADGLLSVKVPEELCCQSFLKKEVDEMQSKNTCGINIIKESDSHNEPTKVKLERAQDGVSQSTVKKGRKNRRRSKNISSRNPAEPINAGKSVPDKLMNGNPINNNITSKKVTDDKSTIAEKMTGEDDAIQCIQRSVDDLSKISSIDFEDGRAEAVDEKPSESSGIESSTFEGDSGALPPLPLDELGCKSCNEDAKHPTAVNTTDVMQALPNEPNRSCEGKSEPVAIQEPDTGRLSNTKTKTKGHIEYSSNEWPIYSLYFSTINSNLPAATDRLHLEVGHNWHYQSRRSFAAPMRQARKPLVEGGCNGILSQPVAMSLDCPPMVRGAGGFAPPVTCNYDSGFISRRQSAYQQGFAAHNVQCNGMTGVEVERNNSWDLVDFPEAVNTQDLVDEGDGHWISEEELEMQTVSGLDYNQYFGGGVMYWNPSDHPGTGYSRPPSLSSDDSSWAWREADMNKAVDEMVAFSSSYSTNGLTSPTSSSFCSPFDTIGPGHQAQALGYVMPGNELSSNILNSSSTKTDTAVEEVSGPSKTPTDIETKPVESFPYPILRPIIIPSMSRERSRSDFKRNYDHKSPRVPLARQEQLQIKRPPSPVVLCVPRAPRPPPPSPVSDSRKHKGFPTVRSGSSSPRHWGMRGWYQEGNTMEDVCFRMDGPETVWPSWRNKKYSSHPIVQPLPGALLQDHLIAMSQLARDQEHPDVAFPLQPVNTEKCSTRKESFFLLHNLLNDEIDYFCNQVAGENMARKPYINWAVKRVTRSLQVLWPRSRTNIFGSNASGLSLPSSDVDLVVCLPPVRNLEPIKEAGILEGRNGIKETWLQHAARYLSNQEWVKSDSLKTVENTAIPIIMLIVEVPYDLISSYTSNILSPKEDLNLVAGEGESHSCSDVIGVEDSVVQRCSEMNNNKIMNPKSVRLDISFKTSTHTGLQTTELVKELTEQYPAVTPLALVLKKFLADRGLDQSYSGGLSSYCLVLLIIRFLQHEYHLGRPINQNFGSLLMDFLYFFGNVFDPRQMRISVQGSGVYIKRERDCSIDPLHIDDPLFSTNNVGRNCFRIHQCIKAFSEAYSVLEDELGQLSENGKTCSEPSYRLLRKIIPSIDVFKDCKI